MALEAGILSLTVEFAKDLKDRDWFGKQDPYVIVRVGGQTYRSRTCVDGGRNPVWNETFKFNLINDNTAELKLMDEDTLSKDDVIGECVVSLAKAREQGHDQVQVPVVSSKSKGKQRGFVSVRLTFETNQSIKPQQAQQAAQQPAYVMPPHPMPLPYPAAYPMPYPPAGYAMPYPGPAPMMMPYPVYATAPAPPQQAAPVAAKQ